MQHDLSIIPNALTLFRGVATAAIVGLFVFPFDGSFMIALLLLCAAAASDYFDGMLARRWGAVSDFGAVFDPLFDKLLVLVLIILIYPYYVVPSLVLLILFMRDIIVDSLKNYLLAQGIVTPAIYSAKLKTTAQLLMLMCALAALAWPAMPFMQSAATVFGIIATILSLWSGWSYVRRFIAFRRGELMSSSQ